MRVAYDISVLGMGVLDPRARTGVYRVVENLAYGLVASDACEVRFCAGGESFHPVYGALRYLEEHQEFDHVSFSPNGTRTRILRRLLDGLSSGLGSAPRGLPARVAQAIRGRGVEAIGALDHPITRASLGDAEVFHSPHGPLPPATRGQCRRFVTVYDLIAITQPHLFEPHVGGYVRRIISSIGPDDWVTCISEHTKTELCAIARLDPERVFVTPLGASRELFLPCTDPERFAAVRARYRLPDAPYLLCLNTLEPRKNLELVIRAFVQLTAEAREEDLHLVLVGAKGWDYSSIFAAAEGAGPASKRIILPGYVADEDLAPLYSNARAFVYPSFHEGFGLPPLEAMQCGLPVVTSNTTSLPEVVGDAGIMVDPHDVDSLSEALLRLCRDADLRVELSARSLARAEQFSWSRCAAETITAYRTALDA